MNRIELPSSLNLKWVEEHSRLLATKEDVILDFSQTSTIDSAGLAFIRVLKTNLARKNKTVVADLISDELIHILNRLDSTLLDDSDSENSFDPITNIKVWFTNLKQEGTIAFSLLTEMLYWGTFGLLKRQDYREGVLGEQMYQLGYGAIGIVMALTYLIGVALAAQSAIQLSLFGADAFLMSMVVMSMVRELGPLMVAIVLAGRTGSATTAEIATMSVQQEVDALKTMGLNHVQHIVVPKFWAISITMPLLTVLGIVSGILGGVTVAFVMAGQSPVMVWNELVKSVIIRDLLITMAKSFVFAWLIIWVGSYYGYRVSGGAEAVGKETTSAVVTAIFVIVIADALFSFIY